MFKGLVPNPPPPTKKKNDTDVQCENRFRDRKWPLHNTVIFVFSRRLFFLDAKAQKELTLSHFSASSSGIRYRFEIVQQSGYLQCIKSIHGKPIIFDKRWSEMCNVVLVTTHHLSFPQSSYKKKSGSLNCAHLSNIQMDIVRIAHFFCLNKQKLIILHEYKSKKTRHEIIDDAVTVLVQLDTNCNTTVTITHNHVCFRHQNNKNVSDCNWISFYIS